jgi:pyruvate dehydrogenase E2 component (dihydrolipoamide acetyltransferase)
MDVLMPQLGETVAEGKVTRWFKSAGDKVKPGDNLFEIETDKVSMEVPATTSGVLSEIRVPVGEVAAVGAVVAVISDAMQQTETARGKITPTPKAPAAGVPAPAAAGASGMDSFSAMHPAPPSGAAVKLDPFFEVRTPARNYGPARLAGGRTITPLARRLAGEATIDLARVKGSGPHGRILARDVEAARAAASGAAPEPSALRAATADEIKSIYRDAPFEEMPLDAMRSVIARRMVAATRSIPQFQLTADIEIARLLDLRESANSGAPKAADETPAFSLSVTDLLIKAWATALQRIPGANAVWAEDRILRLRHSDIGVAVALEGGLLAPIIRCAEMKTLSAISQEMRDLTERARARKLDPKEYQGGSSTISNLGMHGVRDFCAIINPPQPTILAIGAARRQAVERADGSVGFASIMSVTLSCDHRVVDGAVGAQLLAAFRRIVEQPVSMLV